MNNLIISLLHWCLSAVALLATSRLVNGFQIGRFTSALWAALLIGVADAFIQPFLLFITLPINILTLGLFTFVVNGAILKICAAFSPDFKIKGWLPAIFGSVILSIISGFLHWFIV